jgi:hypothetical protein
MCENVIVPLTELALTYPPRTGPKQRARLTILCATPFAKPTACGGVTVDTINGNFILAQAQQTHYN